MKLRLLLAGLIALAGLPVLALAAAPAGALVVTHHQATDLSLDIRAGEYPAGYPTGAGSIKPGDAETFSVSVYGNGAHGYAPLSFGQVASDSNQSVVHFRLYYGWGQKGVVTENGCTGIGQGNTAFCYHQSSRAYFGPSHQSAGSPETVWLPTTDVPAPSTDLTTLFFAVWLIPGPPGDHAAPLVESNAGNIIYDLTAKQVFLTSTWGTGPQVVMSGQPVNLTACITDKDCSSGLVRSGNFLGDYLYVCDTWPPYTTGGVLVTKGLPEPPPQHWWSGKAYQVLGGIKQSFTPPAGQSWSVFYDAFASSHANLAQGGSGTCPTSPGEVDAGTATGIGTDYATLMITWKGPTVPPPSVQLTASTEHPGAGQRVQLEAIAKNPDGNSKLYICARSGTSWLSLSAPNSDGYLGDATAAGVQVPRALGTAAPLAGKDGTAQFIAFLSTDPAHPGSCPIPGATSAAYGTLAPPEWTVKAGPWRGSYDYSQPVNVTWAEIAKAHPTTTTTPTVVPSTTTTTSGSGTTVPSTTTTTTGSGTTVPTRTTTTVPSTTTTTTTLGPPPLTVPQSPSTTTTTVPRPPKGVPAQLRSVTVGGAVTLTASPVMALPGRSSWSAVPSGRVNLVAAVHGATGQTTLQIVATRTDGNPMGSSLRTQMGAMAASGAIAGPAQAQQLVTWAQGYSSRAVFTASAWAKQQVSTVTTVRRGKKVLHIVSWHWQWVFIGSASLPIHWLRWSPG